MNIRPLGDRILVKRLDGDSMSKGGIIIPDTAKEKPSQGLVVAVGNGKKNDNGSRQEIEVRAKDKILFSKYAGTEVKIDGEDHLILREDDILGIVE